MIPKGLKKWKLDRQTKVIDQLLPNNDGKYEISGEKYLYCVAINASNADRKFHKMLGVAYNKNKKPQSL
jgi:hypothetical protein